jgi:hypothetical protein
LIYGSNPLTPIDLAPIEKVGQKTSVKAEERAAEIVKLHEKARAEIAKHNAEYVRNAKRRKVVNFQEGDLVWVYIRKSRFPGKRKSKLNPKVEGPYRVLKWINQNAYQIDLPDSYKMSKSFNVSDLSPFVEDTMNPAEIEDSSQEGENDGGPSPNAALDLEAMGLGAQDKPNPQEEEAISSNNEIIMDEAPLTMQPKVHMLLKAFRDFKCMITGPIKNSDEGKQPKRAGHID